MSGALAFVTPGNAELVYTASIVARWNGASYYGYGSLTAGTITPNPLNLERLSAGATLGSIYWTALGGGKVEVQTKPSQATEYGWCKIYVDGVLVGVSTNEYSGLTYGSYTTAVVGNPFVDYGTYQITLVFTKVAP